MLDHKTYKISPFINNSFEETINFLVKSLLGYEIKNAKKTSPDGVMVSDKTNKTLDWKKPEHIYLTINYMSKTGWTNYGGAYYCELLEKDTKIIINWAVDNQKYNKYELINIKTIRKLKLKEVEKMS